MNYTNKKNTGTFILKENVSFKARNTTHNREIF